MAYFTVIIPLYNKENHIEETLKSVLNQTFQDFEVIIVEDCSTDNSKQKAEAIISEKIRIIQHEANKGLSASRNTGIHNADSDFLAFLDADDIWHEEFLEKIHQLTQEFPNAHLFGTNYTEVYPKKVTVVPSSNLKNFIKDGIVPDFFESNLHQNIYCHCSLCVKKEVFKKASLSFEINRRTKGGNSSSIRCLIFNPEISGFLWMPFFNFCQLTKSFSFL